MDKIYIINLLLFIATNNLLLKNNQFNNITIKKYRVNDIKYGNLFSLELLQICRYRHTFLFKSSGL